MNVLLLSRIQFTVNIAFHYLFPPLSIGLALMIVIMEGLYLYTKKDVYKQMTKFWTNIFALSFAMGVATGIVQVFAFGNNWARYSVFVGDVFGSALAAEGIFAFFLEAGFLGLMLFGWEKVKPRTHYLSTCLVCLGAHFSAIWICVVNSWMQTPAGYKIIGEGSQAKAVVTDFWTMIFNYSSVTRITHVLIGAWLTGAFILLSVSAFYMLKKRHMEFARKTMKIGVITAAITVILQLISADSSAEVVAKHQPVKLAAMEGVFETKERTPLVLIGYPDMKTNQVVGIKIPSLLSLLTYKDPVKAVAGLDQFPRQQWPNVPLVFQCYHLMIYAWGAMFLAAAVAAFLFYKQKIESSPWVLRYLVISVLFPYVANEAGWFTAECGRQPWIVYQLLRTSQGVSLSISAGQVLGSLIMFVCIYALLFALFIFLLNRKIQGGPASSEEFSSDEYRAHIL